MRFFGRKEKEPDVIVQTAVRDRLGNEELSFIGMGAGSAAERRLYRSLRDNVPVVDAAVMKIIRLVGSFRVRCDSEKHEKELEFFLKNVRVGGYGTGISCFLDVYLDQLLTYGTAVGEIVTDRSGRRIAGLYNASFENVELSASDNDPFNVCISVAEQDGSRRAVTHPGLILVSAAMPEPGKLYGTSILKGLPVTGDILLRIFHAIGTNWDRVGNVRFAVSYNPPDSDRSNIRDRAKQIASEWSKAMTAREPRDFVTAGDVSIRVIGADNQIPDSNVPVRQLIEQLLSKLSIPPFMLGLSWSSTERMSSQQADILTSELEYYRRILDGVIGKICGMWFRLSGISSDFEIVWDNINLQDEVELARARLYNAQAEKLERELNGE